MLWTTIMISKKSTTFCNGVNKQVPEVWPLFAETGKARNKSEQNSDCWILIVLRLEIVFGWGITIHHILLDQLRSNILRVMISLRRGQDQNQIFVHI